MLKECSKDGIACEEAIGLDALGDGTKLVSLPFVIENVDNRYPLYGDLSNSILHGPSCAFDRVSEVVGVFPGLWPAW